MLIFYIWSSIWAFNRGFFWEHNSKRNYDSFHIMDQWCNFKLWYRFLLSTKGLFERVLYSGEYFIKSWFVGVLQANCKSVLMSFKLHTQLWFLPEINCISNSWWYYPVGFDACWVRSIDVKSEPKEIRKVLIFKAYSSVIVKWYQ